MGACNLCAKCCYFTHKSVTYKCPYLLPNNLCEIYETRIGTIIAELDNIRYSCHMRANVNKDYEGCPQNKEKHEN